MVKSPPHFCKASLGEGTPLPVVAFQLSPTPGYPVEVVLLCKASSRPNSKTLLDWDQLLREGQSVVLLAGLRTEWTQPEFSGYAYRITGIVGLRPGQTPLDGQFMLRLRHADHGAQPTAPAPAADEPRDYERLLTRFAEGSPPDTLYVDQSGAEVV